MGEHQQQHCLLQTNTTVKKSDEEIVILNLPKTRKCVTLVSLIRARSR